MFNHISVLCALSAFVIALNPASSFAAQAINADSFVDTFGVNTHMSYGFSGDPYYNQAPTVIADLAYIGIHNVRDNARAYNSVVAMGQAGVKFDFMGQVTVSDQLAGTMSEFDGLAQKYPGMIASIEGMNEVSSTESWGGQKGQPAAQLEQTMIYSAAKADPLLANIPIFDFTTVSTSLYSTRAGAANYVNAHIYPQNGEQPFYNANGDKWITWGFQELKTYGLPEVMTEFGYFTIPQAGWNYVGIDEPSQAKGILNALFDAVSVGISKTFIYELIDEEPDPNNTNSQFHYGLFHNNQSPKVAATVLHNLTSLLETNRATKVNTLAQGSLSYTLTNMPTASGNSLLLQKDDGTFVIALWNETEFWNRATGQPINATPTKVLVDFGQTASTINVYDPTVGTTPISTQQNFQGVTIAVPDHVVLVEVVLNENCGSVLNGSTVWLNSTNGSSSAAATPQQCPYGGDVKTTWTNQNQQLCTNGVLTNTGKTQQVALTTQAPDCNAALPCGTTPSGTSVWTLMPQYTSSSVPATTAQCADGGTVTSTFTDYHLQECTNGAWHFTGDYKRANVVTQAPVCITPINGAVGSDNGSSLTSLSSTDAHLCTTGAVSNFATTSSGWTWKCLGSNKGTNATGSATKVFATTIVIKASGDQYLGAPDLVVALDKTVVGTKAVTAVSSLGQSQTFTFNATTEALPQKLIVEFPNDAWGGATSKDRNLYLLSVTVNGKTYNVQLGVQSKHDLYSTKTGLELYDAGTVTFTLTP